MDVMENQMGKYGMLELTLCVVFCCVSKLDMKSKICLCLEK